MKLIKENIIRSPLKLSAILLIVSIFLQMIFHPKSIILGQDFTSISDSILKFYPWFAISEVVKVLLFIFLILVITTTACKIAIAKSTNPRKRNKFFIYCIFLAYCFFLSASVIKFPAAYENFLPNFLNRFIFWISFYLSPVFLNFLSIISVISGALSLYSIKDFKKIFANKGIGSILIALIILGLSPANQLEIKRKPNIVLIGIDSLRTDRFKNPVIMPNISKLLLDKEAVYFTDHHISTPRTFPSWKEILSGKYGASNGIRHMFPSLPQLAREDKGLTKYLIEQGYKTKVISDFAGDIFPRFKSGFEEIDTPNLNLKTIIQMNVDMMFPLFMPFILSNTGRMIFPNLSESPILSDPKILTDKATSYFSNHDNKPFFMTLFYSTAHFPYAAPWPYYNSYSNTDYQGRFLFQKTPDISAKESKPSDSEIKKINSLYDGALSSIDNSLGELFKNLKEKGLWDNSIIVLTADHGEDLFEEGHIQGHGEHLKGENVLKVPLVIKRTKNESTNSISIPFLSRSVDITPTLLGMVGIKNNKEFDGQDLSPWLSAHTPASPPNLFAYSETGIWFSSNDGGFFQNQRINYPGISQILNFDPGGTGEIILNRYFENIIITAKHRSITQGKYKLIYSPTNTHVIYTLYDRLKDPENKVNLATTFPNKTENLKRVLLAYIKELESKHNLADEFVVPR